MTGELIKSMPWWGYVIAVLYIIFVYFIAFKTSLREKWHAPEDFCVCFRFGTRKDDEKIKKRDIEDMRKWLKEKNHI